MAAKLSIVIFNIQWTMMNRFVCCILTLWLTFFIAQRASAQLVNIETKRIHADSVLFSVQNDFSFVLTSNNGDYIYRIIDNMALHVKTRNYRHNFFFVGNYNLFKSKDREFSNILMFHFRHIYKLMDRLRVESLYQIQEDQLLNINERSLAGLGLRLRLINNEHLHLNVGSTYLYEREKSDEFERVDYFHRNSSYCALSFELPDRGVTISNTLYFQPLFKDFSDYRLLEEFKLSVAITKAISLNSLFVYYIDQVTPSGESQSRINSMMGFGIQF